jgi:REP element-mobilizing transposase RayT
MTSTWPTPSPGSAGVPPVSSHADFPGSAGVPPASAPSPEWHCRNYLPHFDREGIVQSITFRLYGSIPTNVIEQWKQQLGWRESWAANTPEALELRRRLEEYADASHGACHLRRPEIATIVQQAIKHFHGKRYCLLAWCVMPNHVHALIETMPGQALNSIVQSWKSYTAHQASRRLGIRGRFWQPDYFDRRIRNEKHLAATIDYIHGNPVGAGLCASPEQWPWSSAGKWEDAGATPAPPGKPAAETTCEWEDAGGTPALPGKPATGTTCEWEDAGGTPAPPGKPAAETTCEWEDAGGTPALLGKPAAETTCEWEGAGGTPAPPGR